MTQNRTGKIASWLRTRGRIVPGATARLRFAFLVPLVGAVAALFGIGIAALHMHEHDMIESEVNRTQTLVERMYRDDIGHNARSLDVAMEVVGHDAVLRAALARSDRVALLRLAAPLYMELRRKFGITHFYFSGPDRVNLLRAHQPDRHGDVIARFTTLEAERTGTTSYGVELGPLGTFTLRLVTPWYAADAEHRLIGYVELGMEVDHVLETVQKFAGVPVFVLVSKKYLKREDWEGGMRILGRTPEWNRFPDAVLSTQAAETLPAALATRLAGGLPAEASVVETIQARAIDRVCRYGGEEITIILPETDLDVAANIAERLRAKVEAQPFDVNAGAPLRITVSLGIASWPAHADSAQALVAAADTALYAAKQGGRNRIIRYEPVPGQPAAQG